MAMTDRAKGWRKFTVALLSLCMGYSLALLGMLTAEFATVAAVTVGAFAAGNAVEHYRGKNGPGTA